ncbi:MAG: DUF1801 domain-containing protein [Pseudomonadota bacterium]
MIIPADIADYIARVGPERRRRDAKTLVPIFSQASGFAPKLWSGSIIGFGRYDYTYASGRSGTWFATGFAPRKARISIHIMPGYQDYSAILDRIGKHKIGKSCLYVNKLDDIDLDVLAELIRACLKDLKKLWPVHPA